MKNPSFIEARPFTPPVFITGCMRSGTSFLAKLLTEHPHLLHLEGELNRVWTEIGGMDCRGSRRYLSRDDIDPQAVANMAAYFERCSHEFTKSKYLLSRIYSRFKKGSGGVLKKKDARSVNKNVHFINRTDYLLHMFPTAKLILIIRPIEAQVNSLRLHFEKKEKEGIFHEPPERKKDSWTSNREDPPRRWNFEDLLDAWLNLNLTALDDLEGISTSRYHLVDHRDLVKVPEKVVQGVYEFLELDPKTVKVGKSSLGRKAFNSHTGGDPLTDWQKRLSKGEKERIEVFKKEQRGAFDRIEETLSKHKGLP